MTFKATNIVRAVDPNSEATKPQDYISMRKHWWQRFVIIKDGAIQGWFISFVFTMVTLIMAILGFVFDRIAKNWSTFGGTYAPIYLGSLTIWFGYKVAQKKVGNGTAGFDISSVTKIITDAVRTATKPKTKTETETENEIPK